jgi:hypothetical protein
MLTILRCRLACGTTEMCIVVQQQTLLLTIWGWITISVHSLDRCKHSAMDVTRVLFLRIAKAIRFVCGVHRENASRFRDASVSLVPECLVTYVQAFVNSWKQLN